MTHDLILFLTLPEKYFPVFGRLFAYAMANEKGVKINLSTHPIEKVKLYLFYKTILTNPLLNGFKT